jgi:hypothetical protein
MNRVCQSLVGIVNLETRKSGGREPPVVRLKRFDSKPEGLRRPALATVIPLRTLHLFDKVKRQ